MKLDDLKARLLPSAPERTRNMAEVTQADRDAATQWCYSQPFPSKQAEAPAIEAGEYDHHSLVQAFAAHREAAEKAERQAVVDLIERERADEQKRSEENKSTKLGSCTAYAELAFRQTLDLINRGDHRKG